MKKFVSVILLGVLILSLSACKPKSVATYQDVLNKTATFITKENKKASLENFELEFDGKKWSFEARNYLITDLDGDKNDEMVITEKENKFKLVLHTQKGKIYGHLIRVKQMLSLKADGTFKQIADETNGDRTICKFKSFNKTSYELNELAKYNATNSEYFIDGEKSNQTVVNKHFKEFEEKENQKNYVKVK